MRIGMQELYESNSLIGASKRVKEAFILCASGQAKSLVKHLKAYGLLPNIDISGRTLVHCAVENMKLEILHALVEMGADLGAANSIGNTALHLTCKRCEDQDKSFQILVYLLAMKLPVNPQNGLGETPLCTAANVLQCCCGVVHTQLTCRMIWGGQLCCLPSNPFQ
eukprot:m.230031 g.230031  ORF g.230031 m.230031 type:complete len:166 (+) comp40052_c0_seq32:976-1473(+)